MASPVDAGRAVTSISTAVSSVPINLPGSISVGDLLILCYRTPQDLISLLITSSGWTQVASTNTDASDDRQSVWYRVADGSEGATQSFSTTTGGAIKVAAVVYRITGAASPGTQLPEFLLGVGTTANADPATITPTGGSKDYLFLAFLGLDSETATFTAPSGYSTASLANTGTGGAVATNCMIATATRQATAASENPAAWTSTAPASGWTSYLLAIHPGAGGTTYTDAGYGAAGLFGAGVSAKVAGAAPGPAFRRQRRASRFLTIRGR